MPQKDKKRPTVLAVSGSAGVGKTTLGRALAAKLDADFIAEGMRERLESGLDLHGLGLSDFRGLLLDLYQEAIDGLDAAARAGRAVVADRGPADFAAFWLFYGLGHDPDDTAEFFGRVRRDLNRFDAVILLPWGAIELEADGIRAPNPWVQLHYQALLEGLLNGAVPPRAIWRMPGDVATVQGRTA